MKDNTEWMVFQRDVLDVLEQYAGFFDSTERVGGLSDNSRPDFMGRITRKDKKEVWVADAKNKRQVEKSDTDRMTKYIEMLKSNPIDLGLEVNEVSDYSFRGIFVTRADGSLDLEFEQVKFSGLHQFLQAELVYTDTGRVVRDVAKMLQRRQLSQSQARLLHRSMKPFQDSRLEVVDKLKTLQDQYVGLDLQRPPFEEKLPVEAMLCHSERSETFLIDVPYSREALDNVGNKIDTVTSTLEDYEKAYFMAVNTFNSSYESDHVYGLDQVEDEISSAAGIMPPAEVADMFTPKVPTSQAWEDGFLEVEGEHENFMLRVYTEDDIKYKVEAEVPEKSVQNIKNLQLNSNRSLGEIDGGKFKLGFEIKKDGTVMIDGDSCSLENFGDNVRAIYQSSVNPVLGQKVNKAVRDFS